GGVAAHVGAGRHGGGDAGLGADPGAPPEGQVAADPRLPAHDDAVAQPGAAGDAHLRHHQAVAAEADVVPHVHQVVQLRPGADDGVVHAPPVHAGVGAHLDVVLQDATADVPGAPVAVGPAPEAESLAADHGAGLEPDAVAEPRPRVADDEGPDLDVVPRDDAVLQHRVGPHDAPGAEPDAAADHRPG